MKICKLVYKIYLFVLNNPYIPSITYKTYSDIYLCLYHPLQFLIYHCYIVIYIYLVGGSSFKHSEQNSGLVILHNTSYQDNKEVVCYLSLQLLNFIFNFFCHIIIYNILQHIVYPIMALIDYSNYNTTKSHKSHIQFLYYYYNYQELVVKFIIVSNIVY